MKKIIMLMIIITAFSYGSQRVVVAEEFTATWCTYCPGAARALDELYERAYDSLVVIAYHSSSSGDPFYSAEAASRATYYSLSGYPTTWFDGTLNEVGGEHSGTMYPFFRHHVTTRLGVASVLEINLTCNYDSIANSGTVTAVIQNTSGSPVSGNLHFVIVENDIPYSWQGMTKLDFVMRDMLPDANGESVTIAASDTIIRSRNFSLGGGWDKNNCQIVVFVQASSRQIYQGAEIAVIQQPIMAFYDLDISEASGNGNGFAEPGETIAALIKAKNIGDATYNATTAIQCSDPYITITGSTPATVNISAGEVDTVISFTFDIDNGCPDPHQATFTVNFNGQTDDLPFIITTQPGFADDIESGQGAWTHSGINDQWHITTHQSNSATHSWYCGLEGSWQYSNENDASLVSPYFVVTPDSYLYFYQRYSLETSWDYGYVELDNGSDFWQTITEVNGTQSSWNQASFALNAYNGETMRLRFRFISDASVTQEGWYIDDVLIPPYIGVAENQSIEPSIHQFFATPSLFNQVTTIKYQIPVNLNAEIKIYNQAGRLVRHFDKNTIKDKTQITWDGADQSGHKLAAGVYFIELNTGENNCVNKVVLLP